MKTASTILIIAAGAAALAAIWTPIGSWWQWAITALVLLLAGAGLSGATHQRGPAPHPADGSDLEQHFREKFEHEQQANERTTVINPTDKPEQIVNNDRPTYGRKSDQ